MTKYGQTVISTNHLLTRLKVLARATLSPRVIRSIKKSLGRYSFDEVDVVHKFLAEQINSKVMIDVGAHYGESFSQFLFDGWTVFAFEPDPQNMIFLKNLVGMQPNLVLDERGCSNESTEGRAFFRSDISTGISSLSSFDSSHSEAGKISTVTIADYLREKGISEIGFLKIDTEGHDLFVLQGVPWEEIKPEVVVAEFEDRKTNDLGYDYHQMAKLLVDNGYTVLISEWHPISQYGAKHKWNRLRRYPNQLQSDKAWGNLIAVLDSSFASQLENEFFIK